MTETRTGRCLCGAVRATVTLTEASAAACHCGMCRRWSGGPLLCVSAAAPPSFEGAEHIRSYDSSPWAERAFCGVCGSNLYYRLKPSDRVPDGLYLLSAGLLDDQSGLRFTDEVFVDEDPGWYGAFEGAERRKRMTGDEVMAMFAPESEG